MSIRQVHSFKFPFPGYDGALINIELKNKHSNLKIYSAMKPEVKFILPMKNMTGLFSKLVSYDWSTIFSSLELNQPNTLFNNILIRKYKC